jgi:hypothetical protein
MDSKNTLQSFDENDVVVVVTKPTARHTLQPPPNQPQPPHPSRTVPIKAAAATAVMTSTATTTAPSYPSHKGTNQEIPSHNHHTTTTPTAVANHNHHQNVNEMGEDVNDTCHTDINQYGSNHGAAEVNHRRTVPTTTISSAPTTVYAEVVAVPSSTRNNTITATQMVSSVVPIIVEAEMEPNPNSSTNNNNHTKQRSIWFWLTIIFAIISATLVSGIGVYCGTGNCGGSSRSGNDDGRGDGTIREDGSNSSIKENRTSTTPTTPPLVLPQSPMLRLTPTPTKFPTISPTGNVESPSGGDPFVRPVVATNAPTALLPTTEIISPSDLPDIIIIN